jgi:hypothetical protein
MKARNTLRLHGIIIIIIIIIINIKASTALLLGLDPFSVSESYTLSVELLERGD